jgi:hypothetical protein
MSTARETRAAGYRNSAEREMAPKNFLHGLSGDEEVGYKNLSNKSIQPAGSLMFCLRARLHRLRKNSVLLKGTASSVP